MLRQCFAVGGRRVGFAFIELNKANINLKRKTKDKQLMLAEKQTRARLGERWRRCEECAHEVEKKEKRKTMARRCLFVVCAAALPRRFLGRQCCLLMIFERLPSAALL